MKCIVCNSTMSPVFSDPVISGDNKTAISEFLGAGWTMGFKCDCCKHCCTLDNNGTEKWYETLDDMR